MSSSEDTSREARPATDPAVPATAASPAAGGDETRARRRRSRRLSVAAAAATLGVGIAIGAALGPGPQSSFAGTELPGLIGALFSHPSSSASAQASGPAEETASLAPEVPRRRHRRKHARLRSGAAAAATEQEGAAPSSSPPPKSAAKPALKPVTSVWLIELSGESFAQALAQPAAAPYIDSQLLPMGTLEASWSALEGSAFASDAALAGLHAPEGSPSPIVNQIVQPACPEGAAGAQCQPGTPGQLTTADAFVKQAVALIAANALYRAHGLIVVTFGSMTQASAAGLPEGAASATLTTQPPAGVLLISPFIRAGARSTGTFDPTSPQKALSALLGK